MQTEGSLLLSLPHCAQVGRLHVYIQLSVTISIHMGGVEPNITYCYFGNHLRIWIVFAAFSLLEYLWIASLDQTSREQSSSGELIALQPQAFTDSDFYPTIDCVSGLYLFKF